MATDDRNAADDRRDIERAECDDASERRTAEEEAQDEPEAGRPNGVDVGRLSDGGDGRATDGAGGGSSDVAGDHLSDTELEALHEVELGLEWLQRAQGHLIEFHHATGHGMDHLDCAESMLRESEHAALADDLRGTVLPHGVVDGDRWSYDVLESFQDTIHTEIRRFEKQVRRELADGTRHVRERRQERRWKERAGDE